MCAVQNNWRPWLCKRSLDGNLIIKRCLNESDRDEVFGDVCDEWEKDRGWITLFCEHKNGSKEFQSISNDTILVFCKLCEPVSSNVTYLGHLLVEKALSCSALLSNITQMAKLSNKVGYNIQVEETPYGIRDITGSHSTLAEVLGLKVNTSIRDFLCRMEFCLARSSSCVHGERLKTFPGRIIKKGGSLFVRKCRGPKTAEASAAVSVDLLSLPDALTFGMKILVVHSASLTFPVRIKGPADGLFRIWCSFSRLRVIFTSYT